MSMLLVIKDHFLGFHTECDIPNNAKHCLHASLSYLPVELRKIVLDYHGKEYGFIENFIYNKIISFDFMQNIYSTVNNLKTLRKRLGYFQSFFKDDEENYVLVNISVVLLLEMFEKYYEEKIKNWNKRKISYLKN